MFFISLFQGFVTDYSYSSFCDSKNCKLEKYCIQHWGFNVGPYCPGKMTFVLFYFRSLDSAFLDPSTSRALSSTVCI